MTARGATLIHCVWTPFGPGWYGEKDSRIYQNTYRDREWQIHEASAKTSMHSGVYLTDDQIVGSNARTANLPTKMKPPLSSIEPTNSSVDHEDLEAEKRRLRARLAELEQRYPSSE